MGHSLIGALLLRCALLLGLLLPAGVSHAKSVYLNGVNIDGVINKTFKDASVRIDAKGNVYITAKGYTVKKDPTQKKPSSVTPGLPPTKRYWLVTEKAAPGMTQYDIDVFINGKWIRKFLSEEDHIVLELTKHLRTGPNKLHLVAKKQRSKTRKSSSPQHYFRMVVGEGDSGGRNVMITKKLLDYKRTALETKDFNEVVNIEVR